jgi:hypothetical protein
MQENLPEEVVRALQIMFGGADVPEGPLPDAPLFEKSRWRMVGRCSSYYFIPESVSRMSFNNIANCWLIVSCSDLKNYDGEIEAFFEWIMPYVDAQPGEFVGYSRYEECNEPTLYYKGVDSPLSLFKRTHPEFD